MVAKSRTRLSDFTFTFHFHALEKEMATHSSVLAWRIPGMVELGELPSMGSHRVGHNWSDLAVAATVQSKRWIIAPSTVNRAQSLVWLSISLGSLPCKYWVERKPAHSHLGPEKDQALLFRKVQPMWLVPDNLANSIEWLSKSFLKKSWGSK